ncbi:MAG: hypothetical protein JNK92_11865 [Dechloromonas sp.]|nr:hypothetical protein [Dechloromonas sp.]
MRMDAMDMSERNRDHKWIIDSAPCKELIEPLCNEGDPSLLIRLFAARVDWSAGYPLVHDRLVTYGAYDDLLNELDSHRKLSLLPTALAIAESAPDRHFHSALFLLASMIPDDAIRPRPDCFSDALLRLRLRAEKLSFLPNLVCAWDSLATRQRFLKSPSDFLAAYSPRQLEIDDSSWRRHFSFPLINHAHRLFKEFPLRMDLLRDRIQRFGARPGERRLIYATRLETSKYWVWRIPGESGTAQLGKIIFVRLTGEEAGELGTWDLYRQFSERDTPDAISRRLMKIEFYPCELEKFGA